MISHFGEAHERGFGVTGECSGEHIQKNKKEPGYLERGGSGRIEERGNCMERFVLSFRLSSCRGYCKQVCVIDKKISETVLCNFAGTSTFICTTSHRQPWMEEIFLAFTTVSESRINIL